METEGTSTILHLAGKMKRPTNSITRRAKRRIRRVTSLISFGVLFSILMVAAFYSASSASTRNKVSRNARQQPSVSSSKATDKALISRENKTVLSSAEMVLKPFGSKTFFGMLMPQAAPPPESIDTFAASGGVCSNTPKDTFSLGEQVCAKVSNAPLRAGAPLRRVTISGTDGTVATSADVTSNPQTIILDLPSSTTSNVNGQTVDNRGTWNATINSTADNGLRAVGRFSV